MPPRYGKLDLAAWSKSAPAINGYKTEPWILKGARILTLNMEIDDDPADNLIPATMHPSIPPYAIFCVTNYPDSPVGPFTIAEVRVSGRTGVRPRGFVLRSFCDNEDARRELAARWGYPAVAGDVKLYIRHDRVVAHAGAGGKPVLECELLDRDVISGGDIQYVASMHLARNRDDSNSFSCKSIPSSPSPRRSAANRGLSCSTTASSRSLWRINSASIPCGPSSIISSKNIRIARPRARPDRVRDEDEKNVRRSRHHRVRAGVQSSDQNRRAHAVLDILSGGRLDVGTGRSATWTNWPAFAPAPTRPRKPGTSSSIACPRCGPRNASRTRDDRGRCPSGRSFPSPTRSRIRPCGSRSQVPAPRSTRPSAGWAASG